MLLNYQLKDLDEKAEYVLIPLNRVVLLNNFIAKREKRRFKQVLIPLNRVVLLNGHSSYTLLFKGVLIPSNRVVLLNRKQRLRRRDGKKS